LSVTCVSALNPATCNPPAPAGGSRRRPREVALLMGASGSCNLNNLKVTIGSSSTGGGSTSFG
jgi:hypothetical protein